MKTKPDKAVLLVRVSSKEQRDAGFSPDAQEKLLVNYANRHEFDIARIFSISETASKPQQRKIFQATMRYIRLHRIRLLVVEKVDRLTRNFKDTVMMDDWLAENDDRQIHFVKDSLVIHAKSTSQEKLNWGVRVVLAKNVIDNLKEETAKGVQEKLAQGGYPGRPTIGYVNVTIERRRVIGVDEVKSPLVQRLFKMMLDPAVTVATATERMKRLGLTSSFGRPLGKSQIAEILRNPFYIGKMRWDGRIYAASHTPIIERETFRAVQLVLDGKGSPKHRTHDPLFQGMVHCFQCRGLISWELQKGRYYGRCHAVKPCSNTEMLREDRLEEQVTNTLNLLICPWPAVVDWAIAESKRDQGDQARSVLAKKRELRHRHEDVKRRADLLYEDRLAGRISGERYDLLSTTLEDQKEALASELSAGDDDWLSLAGHNLRLLMLSQKVSQIYAAGTKEQRRLVLHEFFRDISIEKRELRYTWTETAEAIAKAAKDRPENADFEPWDNGLAEAKDGPLQVLKTTWYRLTSVLRTMHGSYNPACAEHVQQILTISNFDLWLDEADKLDNLDENIPGTA